MICQVRVPDEVLACKLYEEWIDSESSRREEEAFDLTSKLTFVTEIAVVIQYLCGVPAMIRCLDHGMGWGAWCSGAKGLGCQVFGTELSDSKIRKAVADGIGIIQESEIPGKEFDFMDTEQVFEHLPDPRSAVRTLAAGLHPGGILKTSVPPMRHTRNHFCSPDWSVPKGSTRSLNPVAPLEHLNCYSSRSLRLLGRSARLLPLRFPLHASMVPLHGSISVSVAKNMLRPPLGNLGVREGYLWLRKPQAHAG